MILNISIIEDINLKDKIYIFNIKKISLKYKFNTYIRIQR